MSLKGGKFTAKVKEGKEKNVKVPQWLSEDGESREGLIQRIKDAKEDINNYYIIDPVVNEQTGELVVDSNLLQDLQIYWFGIETRLLTDDLMKGLKERILSRVKNIKIK